jgi:tRNA-Thr(GGU) m(6)t(6)A37 methyltransferase TsaA
MAVTFTSIGIIKTPFKDIDGMPIQPSGAIDVPGQLVMDAQYEDGLCDLDGFSHLILLYHFHLSKGYRLTVKPFLDTVKRGLFSTRAPRRPNPIGLSIVRLDRIAGPILHVLDVDMVNGTPLLDIKPYVPAFDVRSDVSAGWLEQCQKRSTSLKSDQRFREKK